MKSENLIEKEMYKIATDFLNKRYGNYAGGVGVVRIETGEYLTSVWNETLNSAVDLCAETGAILEAHKLNKKITHSLCVVRQKDDDKIEILTPCGVCQERLYYFGRNVKCAISNEENKLIFKPLYELQPYYWRLDKK